jgi:hypothetical protein
MFNGIKCLFKYWKGVIIFTINSRYYVTYVILASYAITVMVS